MKPIRTKLAAVICTFFGLFAILGGCATQSGPADRGEAASPSDLVAIDFISSSETEEATYVTIEADAPLTFSSFKKPDPLSVVLIFPETTTSTMSEPPVLDSDLIKQVVVNDGNGGRTARVEFQLVDDASYTASQKGNNVWLTFNRTSAPASSSNMEAQR